jgi:hypothetical protein
VQVLPGERSSRKQPEQLGSDEIAEAFGKRVTKCGDSASVREPPGMSERNDDVDARRRPLGQLDLRETFRQWFLDCLAALELDSVGLEEILISRHAPAATPRKCSTV